MAANEKFERKILKDLKANGIIGTKTFKDFNELPKEEIVNVLGRLAEKEEDPKVKEKLTKIYEEIHWMNDKNLILLSIWAACECSGS